MQRFSYFNVIVAKDVLLEINVMVGEFLLLVMEYCLKGDLRKVIDKIELKGFYYEFDKKIW